MDDETIESSSTPAPRSSAAKQWEVTPGSNHEEEVIRMAKVN